MIKSCFVIAVLLIAAGVAPAFASSTGGDIASVTSASPCLNVATAGVSAAVTLTPQSQILDETGGNYTAATSDACKTVKVGASTGSPTLTVPAAGSFPTNWGGAVYQNTQSATVTVNAASGGFDGAGGAASFSLPTNAWVLLSPETSGNWDALVVSPSVSPPVTPTIVQHPAGCHGAAGTTISCTIAATGSGGHALIVDVQECGNSNCSVTSNPTHLSITAPTGCTLIPGTGTSTSALIIAGVFQCPNVASGITTVTAATSDSGAYYLSAKVLEWSNVPTVAPIAEGGSSAFDNTGTDTTSTCTTGTVTSGDIAYAADFSLTPITVSIPFTLIDSDSVSGTGDADETASSTTTYTANFTHAANYSAAACFGIKP